MLDWFVHRLQRGQLMGEFDSDVVLIDDGRAL
jgi:hypothetical protein